MNISKRVVDPDKIKKTGVASSSTSFLSTPGVLLPCSHSLVSGSVSFPRHGSRTSKDACIEVAFVCNSIG